MSQNLWVLIGKGIAKKIHCCFAVFILLTFVGAAHAAGYTCPSSKKYTSCNSGYYMNGTGAGNSCTSCKTVSATDLSQTCTRNPTTTELSNAHASAGTVKNGTQKCTGKHTGGAGGTKGAGSCSGCSSWGSCSGGTLTITTCSAGYYKDGNSCLACGDNNHYCPGDNTRKTVSDGYYSTGGTSSTTRTGQAACGGNQYYCSGGVRKDVSSGYYSTGGTSTTRTGQSQCGGNQYYCSDGVRKTVSDGYYSTGGTSTTRTGQTACGGNQYYCSGGVQYDVSSGYYSTGGTSTTRTGQSQCTGATYCSGGVQNSCPAATSGWTRGTGTGWSSYISCYEYRNATSISSYCSSGQLRRYAISRSTWASTATEYTTFRADPGAYVSGSGINMTCTVCQKATYSAGGDVHACTSCPSGYPNSNSGASAITQCYSNSKSRPWTGPQAKGDIPANCASVTSWNSCSNPACSYVAYSNSSGNGDGVLKSGCSTNNTACIQTPAAVTAKSGYYDAGTSCSACPSGYPNSASGNDGGITQCYSNTKKRAWTGSQTACSLPSGCATKTCNSCSIAACDYVAYSNSSGNGDGTLKSGCSTNNASCQQTVKSVTANAGYRVSGTACTQCTGATYSAGGTATSCSTCPTIYTDNTTAGKSSANQCQVRTDGGYYIATAQDDEQTGCPMDSFCTSALVNYGSTNAPEKCPDAATHIMTTYPSNYYDVQTITNKNQTWGYEHKKSSSECLATYYGTNERGNFNVESVGYNPDTGKYDRGGSMYYGSISPGYYAEDKFNDTYCDDSTHRMYYRDAKPCPADSYCPGFTSMPLCSSGEYTETNGINACPSGYLDNEELRKTAISQCQREVSSKLYIATAGGTTPVLCPAGSACPGGMLGYGDIGPINKCTGATYSLDSSASCSDCPAGYDDDLSDGKTRQTACKISVPAGDYMDVPGGTTIKECTTKHYCPGGMVGYGSTLEPTACPDPETHLTTEYPDSYYDAKFSVISVQAWFTGGEPWTKETDCRAVYSLDNSRGHLIADNVVYNASTQKYDQFIRWPYYVSINPGYYASSKYDEATCDYDNNTMLYKDAQPCPAGSYCPGLTSMPSCTSGTYNDTLGINACPANYGTSPAQSTANTQCYLTTTAGKWVATKNAAQTSCTAGGFCVGGVKVNYGSTGGRTLCVTGAYSGAGATACIACEDGTTTSGAGQSSCNAKCANATDSKGDEAVKTWAETTWNTNNTVSDLCVAVRCFGGDEGHYLDNGNCPRCDSLANGLYPRSPQGGTSDGPEACFLYESDIPGQYIATQNATSATDCPLATYQAGSERAIHYGEFSECDTCPDNTYADEEGLAQCKKCLENYTTYGEKNSPSACRISCPAGAYLATANATECTNVGVGYWAAQSYVTQGNVGVRNKCASGLTTIGFGAGADEASDCGRVLNVGDVKLYLRSAKKTDLALNVNIGGTTYYGNMSTEDKFMSDGIEKSLKLNVDGTIYSVYDDSGEYYSGGGSSAVSISPNLEATSTVPANYNDDNGLNWSANMPNGVVISGVAGCDSTTAENGDIAASGFTPSGSGNGCYCRITSPGDGGTRWVYATTHNQCSTKCAYMCATNMKGDSSKKITYRTNLYQVAGILGS